MRLTLVIGTKIRGVLVFRASLQYLYRNYLDKAAWFLKVRQQDRM